MDVAMFQILNSAWALLLGMGLLMIANGMQGTILGIRGDIEGFSTVELSIVMSAYFAGFLGGSRMAPHMIARVGHVRVFAALASMISAVLIFYPAITDPWAWTAGRVLIGFCFSAVYVTAESWLNDAATNETRGKALSLYMIVQTGGIVAAQALLAVSDPTSFIPFIVASVLVSLAITPILLSISPTPAFETAKPMSLRELVNVSPLGCFGMLVLGGIFSAQFGMSAVYGAQAGLSVGQVSTFVGMFFVSALLTQYPIGWLSDRMDRRLLITILTAIGACGAFLGIVQGMNFTWLLISAFLVGATSNPLYSLLVAHTNDFLEHEDMAAASGGLVFISGLGAVFGPLIIGGVMDRAGPSGFFAFILILFLMLVAYALYRSTIRSTIAVEDTGVYVAVAPTGATPVLMEIAQEFAIEADQESGEDGEKDTI
jgi:MFS family permease